MARKSWVAVRCLTIALVAGSSLASAGPFITPLRALPGRAATSISTQASPAVQVGARIWDTATLERAVAPTGSVTFRLFGPADPDCQYPIFTSATTVSPTGVAVSGPYTVEQPGTYRWIASYSGDVLNAAATGACNDAGESVIVVPATTTTFGATLDGRGVASVVVDERIVAGQTTIRPTTSTRVPPATTREPTSTQVAVSMPAPPPPSRPAEEDAVRRELPRHDLPPYVPAAHAEHIVGLQISAFAILALSLRGRRTRTRGDRGEAGRGGETAESGEPGESAGGETGEAGELVGTDVERADEGLGAFEESQQVKWGDGSRTWRWAATPILDGASRRWPRRISRRSPLAARVLNDAGYLRAMLGSLSLALPLLGLTLGVAAARAVGGEALPPPFALAIALAVLGVFDALAGVVAVGLFVGGVVISGGVATAADVRTLMGVATLWFAAPLIAGTARPLRRPRTMTFDEHFDRTADVVIASLVGAWAVLTILEGLPGLSGLDLPIATRASEGALVVLGALTLRMLIETAAAHGYPRRLAQVQPADLPEPGRGQRMAASILVLGLFLFVAASYLGPCWQLYVGAALFILPKMLDLLGDRLPSYPRVQAVTPHGIVQIVFLLAVGVALAVVVLSRLESGLRLIRDSFVLLALPGAFVAVLELVGGEAPARELKWQYQLLGIPLIALGVLLALGAVA